MILGGAVPPATAVAQAAPDGASATEGAAPPPAPKNPASAARRRRRPMYEAVEKAVDEVMRRHYDPCAAAAQRGVPCFPSRVDVEGPRYSVADAMRKYRPSGGRAEGAPINATDIRGQMSGAPLSASGGASIDPVCTVKSLIRQMSGTGKFYLYRLSDGHQDRPVLTDRKIELAIHATNPQARYEYMGEYSGECEAIAAWRKALREAVAPPAADEVTIPDRASSPDSGSPPP